MSTQAKYIALSLLGWEHDKVVDCGLAFCFNDVDEVYKIENKKIN